MDALTALTTRQSPNKLKDNQISDDILNIAFDAAISAPDHGKLRPWKFLVFRGEARNKLGNIFADALQNREENPPKIQIENERAKPLRAPVVIAVIAKIHPENTKIPAIEQILSAGAAAQNIMLAFHAQGYGCMWKTGSAAYDDTIKSALKLAPKDHIVGFLYGGELEISNPTRDKLDNSTFVEYWS